MPTFEIKDGRILTWSLEAHIVDHCNLACQHCCTLSPHLDERTMSVDALAADLDRAKRALRPNVFKLTGGEPLLHPNLLECLRTVRRSGIAEAIQVTTNGHLIKRAPPAFWEEIDRLTVSFYSSAPLAQPLQSYIETKTDEHDVELIVKDRDSFQVMDAGPPPHSDEKTREIHENCWLRVRCHMIYDGRFYTCTRPPHIRDRLADHDIDLPLDDEGVDLAGDRLAKRIKDYLESDVPLESCRYCLGGSGDWEPHRQL
ncbi:MAG: radical SAM protein [Bradymonadaceae bacterium]